MARPKNLSTTLEELRARHIHCVTMNDINRDIRSGRIPGNLLEKMRDKNQLLPSCSHPEDKVCAAPSIKDEDILEKLNGILEGATRVALASH